MREWHETLRGLWAQVPIWLRWGLPILAALGLFFLVLWKVPQWQVPSACLSPKECFELENEARKTLAQILGGGLLLLGIYLTWRRIRATERQVEVAQEEQITERFTRAIEQLGSDKLEVRLGGIYALERIARDSEKDHWPIMEVLTAYVRERAPWKEEGQPSPEQTAPEPEQPQAESKQPVGESKQKIKPPTDIQAILTVIGRRLRTCGQGEDQALYLSSTDLRGADLGYAHLERALLVEAHMEGTILAGAHLDGSKLIEAHLERAILVGARLEEAHLTEAHLQRVILVKAHMERAILIKAHLDRAILVRAHLKEADLSEAHLEGAHLSEANLEGAMLKGAHLERARLRGAHLERADLSGAVGLTREQIDSAIIDEHTKLPDYLKRPAPGKPDDK